MAKPGQKSAEMRHVSFRMPTDVYRDYAMVADARGIDLSALLNLAVSELRPLLLFKHAQHQAGMLRAAINNPLNMQGNDSNLADALVGIDALIQQMEGVADLLRKRLSKEDGQRAA